MKNCLNCGGLRAVWVQPGRRMRAECAGGGLHGVFEGHEVTDCWRARGMAGNFDENQTARIREIAQIVIREMKQEGEIVTAKACHDRRTECRAARARPWLTVLWMTVGVIVSILVTRVLTVLPFLAGH